MHAKLFLIIGLIFLIGSPTLQAAKSPVYKENPKTFNQYPDQAALKVIIELGLAAQHQEALELANQYAEKHASHACGYFTLGLVHEWIIEPQIPEPFLGPAIKAFEKAGNQNPQDSKASLDVAAGICRGAALMRLARIYYKYGETVKGVRRGIAGAKELQRIQRINPDAYDIYTFLGPYHYFTDRAPAPARWVMRLLGLKGDRDLGLQELQLAWYKAPLFSSEAGHVLYVVQSKYEGKYSKYKNILETLVARYPKNEIYQRLYNQDKKQYAAHP